MGRLGFGRVTGAGLDIGTSIMTKYGDDLAKVAIKSGKLADDAASGCGLPSNNSDSSMGSGDCERCRRCCRFDRDRFMAVGTGGV